MRLDSSDISELRPLLAEVIRSTIEEVRATEVKLGDRLAYPEAEAAALCGVPRHVIRDARLRGELQGRKVGAKIVISRAELLRFLAEDR